MKKAIKSLAEDKVFNAFIIGIIVGVSLFATVISVGA